MKRIIVLIFAIVVGNVFLFAQNVSLYDGMYSKEWQVPRDNHNDDFFKYVTNQRYASCDLWGSSRLYQKVTNAYNQAKGGVRIETSSPSRTVSSSGRVTYQQAQQIKKANRDAEHRAWLAQREEAKAQEAERRRQEEERRREEERIKRQMKHDRILAAELERTAPHYARLQNKIAYRANEGRYFMYNYQPEGTEKIQSGYIPSSSATYDISKIIANSGKQPIRLNGNEYYKSNSNWDDFMEKELAKDLARDKMIGDLLNEKTENIANGSDASFGIISKLTEQYLNNPSEQDLAQLLHDEFNAMSGIDIDTIMQKLPSERTKAENDVLIEYQKFQKAVTNNMVAEIKKNITYLEETKDFEMAILAEDSYGDSKHQFISETGYTQLTTDDFQDNTSMKSFSQMIDSCNSTNSTTGFHAGIYYNEKTNEYTISFEGSNMHPIASPIGFINDWWENNFEQGVNEVPEQYKLAAYIASHIPKGTKINFTGHSLGGGLASVAGLISGVPTYTYNPEGVNEKIINTLNLSQKVENKDYQIKCFQSKADPLTFVQENPIGKAVSYKVGSGLSIIMMLGGTQNTGEIDGIKVPGTNNNPNIIYSKGEKLRNSAIKGELASSAIGTKINLGFAGFHRIKPMIHKLRSKRDSVQDETRKLYSAISQLVREENSLINNY